MIANRNAADSPVSDRLLVLQFLRLLNLTALLIVLSCFHYYTAGFGLLRETTHRGVHLAFVLGLIFLVFPRPQTARGRSAIAREWGWALSFAAFYLYLAWDLVAELSRTGD